MSDKQKKTDDTIKQDDNDDIEIVDADIALGDKLKKLQKKLKHTEEEKRELHENLQRERADFLNSKRRLLDDRVKDEKRLIKKHVEKLLPLCDSFSQAMSNKEQWDSVDPTWRDGVMNIYNQLQSILKEYGVFPFDPTGLEFDPSRHEAISNEPVKDESKHDTVLATVQLGYEMVSDRTQHDVIRPARVIVGLFTNS